MDLALEDFFDPGGQLDSATPAYEPRPTQHTLACHVGRALTEGHVLMAEAGTGTGKTLAYLVPAILYPGRVLISTATKHLQDQILHHDLPLAERALGRPVAAALMKGRTNYLCELRAEVAMALPLRAPKERHILQEVARWRLRTQTGDRAELEMMDDHSSLWRELTATSEQCVGRTCPHYERCWVVRMRRQAHEAELVIVNHHLYFADAAVAGSKAVGLGTPAVRLLPPIEAIVFDEAHEIDDIATQHYGHQVSMRQVDDLMGDIVRTAGGDRALVAQLERPITSAQRQAQALFDGLPEEPRRMLLSQALPTEHIDAHLGPLTEQLAELEATLADADDDELRGLGRRAAHLSRSLGVVLDRTVAPSMVAEAGAQPNAQTAPDFVRYTETTSSHRIAAARPVDVSALLGALFAQQPTVFVSATMRMGDSFEHLKRRLGVPKARELFVESPFDYPSQTCLYVAADLPEPDSPQFLAQAAARTEALVRASGGGAFVLCTSHRAVTALGEALRRAGLSNVLMQGEAPKASLVETFVAHGNAVLVATMGFWRGVDVPGRALRLVILDKLPFQSPYDPLVQARLAQLTAQELDPFLHYQLPQAALLLRQGFGRLVRSTSDHGMVAILDARLKTRRYGALLIAALPRCPEVHTLAEAEAKLHAFESATQPAPTPVGN